MSKYRGNLETPFQSLFFNTKTETLFYSPLPQYEKIHIIPVLMEWTGYTSNVK